MPQLVAGEIPADQFFGTPATPPAAPSTPSEIPADQFFGAPSDGITPHPENWELSDFEKNHPYLSLPLQALDLGVEDIKRLGAGAMENITKLFAPDPGMVGTWADAERQARQDEADKQALYEQGRGAIGKGALQVGRGLTDMVPATPVFMAAGAAAPEAGLGALGTAALSGALGMGVWGGLEEATQPDATPGRIVKAVAKEGAVGTAMGAGGHAVGSLAARAAAGIMGSDAVLAFENYLGLTEKASVAMEDARNAYAEAAAANNRTAFKIAHEKELEAQAAQKAAEAAHAALPAPVRAAHMTGHVAGGTAGAVGANAVINRQMPTGQDVGQNLATMAILEAFGKVAKGREAPKESTATPGAADTGPAPIELPPAHGNDLSTVAEEPADSAAKAVPIKDMSQTEVTPPAPEVAEATPATTPTSPLPTIQQALSVLSGPVEQLSWEDLDRLQKVSTALGDKERAKEAGAEKRARLKAKTKEPLTPAAPAPVVPEAAEVTEPTKEVPDVEEPKPQAEAVPAVDANAEGQGQQAGLLGQDAAGGTDANPAPPAVRSMKFSEANPAEPAPPAEPAMEAPDSYVAAREILNRSPYTRVLRATTTEPKSVGDIAATAGVDPQLAKEMLQEHANNGNVEADKDGRYFASDPERDLPDRIVKVKKEKAPIVRQKKRAVTAEQKALVDAHDAYASAHQDAMDEMRAKMEAEDGEVDEELLSEYENQLRAGERPDKTYLSDKSYKKLVNARAQYEGLSAKWNKAAESPASSAPAEPAQTPEKPEISSPAPTAAASGGGKHYFQDAVEEAGGQNVNSSDSQAVRKGRSMTRAQTVITPSGVKFSAEGLGGGMMDVSHTEVPKDAPKGALSEGLEFLKKAADKTQTILVSSAKNKTHEKALRAAGFEGEPGGSLTRYPEGPKPEPQKTKKRLMRDKKGERGASLNYPLEAFNLAKKGYDAGRNVVKDAYESMLPWLHEVAHASKSAKEFVDRVVAAGGEHLRGYAQQWLDSRPVGFRPTIDRRTDDRYVTRRTEDEKEKIRIANESYKKARRAVEKEAKGGTREEDLVNGVRPEGVSQSTWSDYQRAKDNKIRAMQTRPGKMTPAEWFFTQRRLGIGNDVGVEDSPVSRAMRNAAADGRDWARHIQERALPDMQDMLDANPGQTQEEYIAATRKRYGAASLDYANYVWDMNHLHKNDRATMQEYADDVRKARTQNEILAKDPGFATREIPTTTQEERDRKEWNTQRNNERRRRLGLPAKADTTLPGGEQDPQSIGAAIDAAAAKGREIAEDLYERARPHLEALHRAAKNPGQFVSKVIETLGQNAKPYALKYIKSAQAAVERVKEPAPGTKAAADRAEQTAPMWYNRIDRAINEKMPDKMPFNSFLSMLRKQGVSETEIRYSELQRINKGGEVSKEDALKHIQKYGLQIEEHALTKSLPDKAVLEAAQQAHLEALQRRDDFLDSGGTDPDTGQLVSTQDYEQWKHRNRDKIGALTKEVEKARDAARQLQYDPGFEHYSTPGGSDYTELAFVLPSDTVLHETHPLHSMGPLTKNNRIGWARFKTKVVDGLKSLVIEEIQSDWNQAESRSDPNSGHRVTAPFVDHWMSLITDRMIRHAVDNGFEQIVWPNGDTQIDRYPGTRNYIRDVEHKAMPEGTLPDNTDTGYTKGDKLWRVNVTAGEDSGQLLKGKNLTEAQLRTILPGHVVDDIVAGAGAKKGTWKRLDGIDEWHGGGAHYLRQDEVMKNAFEKRLKAKADLVDDPYGRDRSTVDIPDVHTYDNVYGDENGNVLKINEDGSTTIKLVERDGKKIATIQKESPKGHAYDEEVSGKSWDELADELEYRLGVPVNSADLQPNTARFWRVKLKPEVAERYANKPLPIRAQSIDALVRAFEKVKQYADGKMDDPLYDNAMPHLSLLMAGAKDLKEFITRSVKTFGENVRPYAERFWNEVKSGAGKAYQAYVSLGSRGAWRVPGAVTAGRMAEKVKATMASGRIPDTELSNQTMSARPEIRDLAQAIQAALEDSDAFRPNTREAIRARSSSVDNEVLANKLALGHTLSPEETAKAQMVSEGLVSKAMSTGTKKALKEAIQFNAQLRNSRSMTATSLGMAAPLLNPEEQKFVLQMKGKLVEIEKQQADLHNLTPEKNKELSRQKREIQDAVNEVTERGTARKMTGDALTEMTVKNQKIVKKAKAITEDQLATAKDKIKAQQAINKALEDEVRRAQRLRKKLAQQGVDLNDPEAMKSKEARRRAARVISSEESGISDILLEYYKNALFSTSAPTKFIGDAAQFALEFGATRPVEMVINSALGIKGGATVGELPHLIRGILPGLSHGMRSAIETMRTEDNAFERDMHRHDPDAEFISHRKAIPGSLGRAVRTPGTTLGAVTEFWKALNAHVQVGANAYRIAKQMGLSGDELGLFIHQQMDDLQSASWQKAIEFGRHQSFTGKSVIPSTFRRMRNNSTLLKFLIPVMETPAKLFVEGARDLPGIGQARVAKKLLSGDPSYTQAELSHDAARQVVMALGALGIAHALGMFGKKPDGNKFITGTLPIDTTTPGIRMAESAIAPPHSILLGGKYYDYEKTGSVGLALSAMTDTVNAFLNAENAKGAQGAAETLMAQLSQTVTDNTFLRSVGDIMDAVRHSESKTEGVGNWMTNFAASWVPSVVRKGIAAADPYVRETKPLSFVERLSQRALPTPSKAFPQIDLFGREEKKDASNSPESDFFWRIGVPIKTQDPSDRTNLENNLYRMILNYNNRHEEAWGPPRPPVKYKDRAFEGTWTPEQYYNFSKKAGQYALQIAAGMSFNFDEPTQIDKDLLDKAIAGGRKAATAEMLDEMTLRDHTIK